MAYELLILFLEKNFLSPAISRRHWKVLDRQGRRFGGWRVNPSLQEGAVLKSAGNREDPQRSLLLFIFVNQ